MRKCLFAVLLMSAVLWGCKGGKQESVSQELEPDTMTVVGDSAAQADNVPMPSGADELFDDFFFNYASNKHLQLERTMFPLVVKDGEKQETISQKQWKMEPFFTKQDYYTLIFDSSDQLELLSDTNLIEVIVERFYLKDARVEQFMFSRKSGRWMLHEINHQPMPRNPNAQFLSFYQRFTTDSVFQYQSLAEQIEFSGPDPEDDFSTIDGVITPDFWEGFAPEMPKEVIYNIVYGHQNPASLQKVFLIRGIANGEEIEMTFKLRKGHWKLTKLTT